MMKKKLKLLASPVMIALGLAASQLLHAMEQDNFQSIEDAWKTHYGVSESEYQLLKTIKIQYRPNSKSDMDMITLTIPTFANPFDHKFDLSECGDTGKYLCISMGYRTDKNFEDKDLVEIFIAPRKMIKKDLDTSAAHYKQIMTKWSEKALIGIIYTWGEWKDNNKYEYVTNHTPIDISTKNCLQLYEKSEPIYPLKTILNKTMYRHISGIFKNFTFILNQDRDY